MKRILALTLGVVLGMALLLLGVRAQEGEPGGEPEPPKKAPAAKGPGAKGAAPKAAPKVVPKAAPKGAPKKGAPKGAPKKGGPKGKGGEGEEEEGEGVFVLLDTDAVVLRDGTRINGTIICSGQAAVTILTPEGEKTIAREQIERIVKNTDAGLPKKFVPEELDGHKYLKDTEGALPPPAKAVEPKGPDIVALEPPAPEKAVEPPPPAPVPPAKAKAFEPPAKEVAPVPPPKAPATPAGPKQLPPIVFPKTQAEIHALIEKLRREGTLNDYLADPKFRDGFREAVREAFKNEAPKAPAEKQ